MTGNTLILSRAVKLHDFYKRHLEGIGFKNIFCTDVDKDGLNMVIEEKKPCLVMIEACFYKYATPYMMFELLLKFPKLNIAVVNMYDYPEDNAKNFILNGVNSYLSLVEGIEEFNKGLIVIRSGKYYISPNIVKILNEISVVPVEIYKVRKREIEVLNLLCNGRKEVEIANLLHISKNTVQTHKYNLFDLFNVENTIQLFWAALAAGKVRIDDSFMCK